MTRKARSKARKNPKRRRTPKKRIPKRTRRYRQRGRPLLGTEDWMPEFLKNIMLGMHITDACAAAKVHPSTVYKRKTEEPGFSAAWAEASFISTEALEAEASRRAFHGVERPLFHGGEQVGKIKEYSDTLMARLLQARDPARYGATGKFELTGKGGEALGPTVGIYLPNNGRDPQIVQDGPNANDESTPAAPGADGLSAD